MALIERRDPAEITVTVRHRCPDFAFGSALGPYALVTWWWMTSADHLFVMPDHNASPDPPAPIRGIVLAVRAALAGTADLRRHLDELAELPDVPS